MRGKSVSSSTDISTDISCSDLTAGQRMFVKF